MRNPLCETAEIVVYINGCRTTSVAKPREIFTLKCDNGKMIKVDMPA